MSEDDEAFASRSASGKEPIFTIMPTEGGRALRSIQQADDLHRARVEDQLAMQESLKAGEVARTPSARLAQHFIRLRPRAQEEAAPPDAGPSKRRD